MRGNDQLFTLEPRDALLVRDGRSMNANVGRSLPFPHPSTLAGVVRTRLGQGPGGLFDRGRAGALRREVSIAGPLLARLAPDGDTVLDVLAPAPADCVWFVDDAGRTAGRRLAPRPAEEVVSGALTDLGAGAELCDFAGAAPVGKPTRARPFWSWKPLLQWLTSPRDGLVQGDVEGVEAFPRELRTHVTIDAATGTAEDGALFGTESVRLALERPPPLDGPRVRVFDRFALLGSWQGPGKLPRGLVPLGGERRGAFLEPVFGTAVPSLAAPPEIDKLRAGSRARVVLLTPALFATGSFPDALRGARVVAAKVDRPEVVSGWNFESNAPKPSRRMAAAGSVFWVEVPTDTWARDVWLTSVSDDDQDQRDGFGLAVVGVA